MPDESVCVVFLGEACGGFGFVFLDSVWEVGGDACVKDLVVGVGENVDGVLLWWLGHVCCEGWLVCCEVPDIFW